MIGEHEFPLVRLSKLSLCIKKRKKIPKFKLLPDFVIPDPAPGSTSHHSCCTMLAGVSKNASLAMSVAVKITLRSHGCPSSTQAGVPVLWLPSRGGGKGLISRGLPSSISSRHPRNRKEKQNLSSVGSSPSANQATCLTFFF